MRSPAQRLMALAARDVLWFLFTAGVWTQALAQPTHPGWAAGAALTTAFGGYLLHEWGHWLGARLRRCAIEYPATPFETFFLFRFRREENSRAQFFSMALGGFAASILTVVGLLLWLPSGLLATSLTLVLTGLGVVATLVIEVPEFWRVWRGGPIPSGAAFIKGSPPPAA